MQIISKIFSTILVELIHFNTLIQFTAYGSKQITRYFAETNKIMNPGVRTETRGLALVFSCFIQSLSIVKTKIWGCDQVETRYE